MIRRTCTIIMIIIFKANLISFTAVHAFSGNVLPVINFVQDDIYPMILLNIAEVIVFSFLQSFDFRLCGRHYFNRLRFYVEFILFYALFLQHFPFPILSFRLLLSLSTLVLSTLVLAFMLFRFCAWFSVYIYVIPHLRSVYFHPHSFCLLGNHFYVFFL